MAVPADSLDFQCPWFKWKSIASLIKFILDPGLFSAHFKRSFTNLTMQSLN